MSFASSPQPQPPTVNGRHPAAKGSSAGPQQSVAAHPEADSASHHELAGWLLASEVPPGADTSELAAGVERVCQRLLGHLSRLLAPGGCQALLARALYLGRGEFPFLAGVRAGRLPEACLANLSEQLLDIDPDQAEPALAAVLSALLDLLVEFIGQDLTLRLVQQVWSDLPRREPNPPPRSANHEAPS